MYNSNLKYANISTKVWLENGESYQNLSFETFVDLDRIIVRSVFAIPRDENDKNFENIILQSSVDTCKMMQGNRANFLVKMFMDQINKTSDIGSFTCPFPKVSFEYFEEFKLIFNFISRKNSTSSILNLT
jgi:Protein of unknown function (DUF1091)